jgi:Arc/MetJ-type ribon-helix-helix transcriptional regulator
MTRKRSVFVGALPLSSLPQLEQLLVPFLGDKGSRGHVVMVRLGDDNVARLDDLVESGLFGSRSEAAAFLIGAGIQAQRELFERIAMQTSEIKRLRTALRETARAALGAGGPRARLADAGAEDLTPRPSRPSRPIRPSRPRRRQRKAAAPTAPTGKGAPERS